MRFTSSSSSALFQAICLLFFLLAGASLTIFPARGGAPIEKPRSPALPNSTPPAVKDAIVLFGGKAEDLAAHWVKRDTDHPVTWPVIDEAIRVTGTNIATKQHFGDIHLHVEFRVPLLPLEVKGQKRGNSGIKIQGKYEIQILDSFGLQKPGKGDCGALYAQAAPLLNACKPPMEWQSYDIVFRAPRFDDRGEKTANARVTVLFNGVVIQNNQEIKKPTGNSRSREEKLGPIVLQDHSNPVEFRNIWVVPLPEEGFDKYAGE